MLSESRELPEFAVNHGWVRKLHILSSMFPPEQTRMPSPSLRTCHPSLPNERALEDWVAGTPAWESRSSVHWWPAQRLGWGREKNVTVGCSEEGTAGLGDAPA